MTEPPENEQPEPSQEPTKPSPSEALDQYERIVDRAHQEIDGVRTVYKWLLATVGIGMTCIFVVGIYFSHQSMSDFKTEIAAEGEKLKKDLTRESEDLGNDLKDNLRASMLEEIEKIREDLHRRTDELSDKVQKRVETEFEQSNISTMIKSNAIARVAEVADPLINKEIDTRLTPRLIASENRLATLDDEIGKARGTRDDLKARSEFTMAVIFAQNDDRKSFDQLKEWSEDPSFAFKNEAQQAWIKIMDEHATPITFGGFTVPWAEGVDPSKLTFGELRRDFSSAPPFVRVALLEYIWNQRDDVSKEDKMQFLADILKSDESLRVVEQAGRFFTSESKQKIKPLAVEVLLDWWHKNKTDYEKAQPEDPDDKE